MEEMLGLSSNWEYRIAEAVVENYYRGRTDLHAGNFGFRNVSNNPNNPQTEIVFYDA